MGIDLFHHKSEIADRDRQLGDAKATMDKYLRDYDALFTRTQKVRMIVLCAITVQFE